MVRVPSFPNTGNPTRISGEFIEEDANMGLSYQWIKSEIGVEAYEQNRLDLITNAVIEHIEGYRAFWNYPVRRTHTFNLSLAVQDNDFEQINDTTEFQFADISYNIQLSRKASFGMSINHISQSSRQERFDFDENRFILEYRHEF